MLKLLRRKKPAEPVATAPAAPPPAAWADRTWQAADGLHLHARDYAPCSGEARLPVVCLHGLTRNAADFETLAPWIAARGRRVLAVDVRGRGLSAHDPEPMRYVPITYAGDVLCLLDGLGIARALFVGTSMGGIITMLVASLRPLAVAGAVLNDVGPSLNPEGLGRIGAYVGNRVHVSGWAEAADYARKINERAFPHYGQAQWEAFARRLFLPSPGGGLHLAYDPAIAVPFKNADPSLPPPDLTPLFLGLATGRPSLLVHGELSDLLDQDRVLSMRLMAPEMDYALVKGVGHAPMLDEPEALDALAKFLDSTP
jgi:pimeloyl-ACP methyl ester carboxylesterase